ncbi:MAG TPA: hypothetical protein VGP76_17690 [Planctomycetaceae bacterium]|jgi:hypothetical protein|nr:hypothetical protein [Planctomycetaceae bacterium]
MRDRPPDYGLSDDEKRICDRLASWAWAIILGFDGSIVLVLLYSYLAPQPRPIVVTIWTWATLIAGAGGFCALLIWLSRQPAFGQPQESPTEKPAASN